MERVWDYERYAAECLLLSVQTTDPAAKARMMAVAQIWARLAELAEKNARNDIVYETPRDLTQRLTRKWGCLPARRPILPWNRQGHLRVRRASKSVRVQSWIECESTRYTRLSVFSSAKRSKSLQTGL